MKVRQILNIHGLMAKKSLGQNFICDESFVQRIVKQSGVGPDDTVLEIGPGLGVMTRVLGERSARVIALEIDGQLLDYLRSSAHLPENVTLVHTDALRYDWGTLPAECRVVANLPYNISSQILMAIVEHQQLVQSFSVMLQREMALRAMGESGTKDFGPLAIYLRLYYDLELSISRIPPSVFYPAPGVESSVLQGRRLPQPRFPVGDFVRFQKLVRLSFSHRRKTLKNNYRGTTWFETFMDQAPALGISPELRAEALSLEQFYLLYRLLED